VGPDTYLQPSHHWSAISLQRLVPHDWCPWLPNPPMSLHRPTHAPGPLFGHHHVHYANFAGDGGLLGRPPAEDRTNRRSPSRNTPPTTTSPDVAGGQGQGIAQAADRLGIRAVLGGWTFAEQSRDDAGSQLPDCTRCQENTVGYPPTAVPHAGGYPSIGLHRPGSPSHRLRPYTKKKP
jgi:hypothetical protein